MRVQIAIVFVCLLLASPAYTQSKEAFICTDRAATGFSTNGKDTEFKSTTYSPNRFTLVREGNEIRLRMFNNDEVYRCETPWKNRPHLVQCIERFFFVVFDSETQRYVRSIMYGYVDRSTDNIALHYGDCQRF
jgi:hypothetical protein